MLATSTGGSRQVKGKKPGLRGVCFVKPIFPVNNNGVFLYDLYHPVQKKRSNYARLWDESLLGKSRANELLANQPTSLFWTIQSPKLGGCDYGPFARCWIRNDVAILWSNAGKG